MKEYLSKLSAGFSSGSFGGLLLGVVYCLMMYYGGFAYFGVHIPWMLSEGSVMTFFAHQVLWGGIAGFLFALPVFDGSWWKRGLLFGLVPALVWLFYVYPFVMNAGFVAQDYGRWTWAVVFGLYWFWGLASAAWYEGVAGK